jgi:cell fate (sporulation/competence/biofilm development) regulator YmcA (YheA/YmcA/DUF963 family)
MYVGYPQCPKCQHPLVKCKRYSRVIKKIYDRIAKTSSRWKTLSGSKNDATFIRTLNRSITYAGLPEHVIEIVKRNNSTCRQYKLAELFVHVVNLFQERSDVVSIERDMILKAIYEHVKKKNSLFLTRQQWLDLENEYNRLTLIDHFRTSKELLQSDSKEIEIQTLNDILFGPNQFTQLACQICHMLLNNDKDSNNNWKSILLDETTWDDFEKDRLICDGKWVICPQGEEIGEILF